MHSWPTYPRRGVIGAAIWAGAVAALAAPAQAIEISAPAEGSVLEYRCNMLQVGDFVQRYTVRQLSGKIVRVEVSDHRGSHSYTKPFYLGGTTLIHIHSL